MAVIRENTRKKLKDFVSSDKFKTLRPATQEKLLGYLDIEEKSLPKTPVQKFTELVTTEEGREKLIKGAISNPMNPNIENTADLAFKTLGAFGQVTEAPGATLASELQKKEAMPTAVAGLPGLIGQAIYKPKEAEKFLKGIKDAPREAIIGSDPKYYKDVFKEAGAPDPLAGTLGFLTSMSLDPTSIRQALLTTGIKGGSKVLEKAGRTFKLLKMKDPAEEIATTAALNKNNLINSIEKTNNKIKDLSLKFSNRIRKTSYETALDFQEELPKFFRANSNEYGKQLFDIAENMPKETKFTVGELSDIFEESLSEIVEQGADEGRFFGAIKNVAKKYDIEVTKVLDDGTFEVLHKDPERVVNFANIVKDMKNIGQKLKAGARKGTSRWSNQDRGYAILKKNFGDSISDRVPAFEKLQSKYKEVIQLMDDSNRVFTPGRKGTLSTKKGEEFLKKIAEGKASEAEKVFLEKIQSGIEEFQGVGNLTNRLKRISKRAKNIKEFGQQMIDVAKIENKKITERDALIAKQAFELYNKAKKVKKVGKWAGTAAAGATMYALLQRPIINAISKMTGD